MSICRWCYEEETTTVDGLCQGCAESIHKEQKETEKFDLDKWLEEDKVLLQAKDVKKFLLQIPDDAKVVLTDGIITCMFGDNTLALNKFGAEWDNGVGYYSNTIVCGECTHFDCSKCGKETE